jgi:hypothetical protein
MDNIKMHLEEITWYNIDCFDLAHERNQWRAVMNMKLNIWFP